MKQIYYFCLKLALLFIDKTSNSKIILGIDQYLRRGLIIIKGLSPCIF